MKVFRYKNCNLSFKVISRVDERGRLGLRKLPDLLAVTCLPNRHRVQSSSAVLRHSPKFPAVIITPCCCRPFTWLCHPVQCQTLRTVARCSVCSPPWQSAWPRVETSHAFIARWLDEYGEGNLHNFPKGICSCVSSHQIFSYFWLSHSTLRNLS